jgi:threonine dehydratase
MKIRGQLAGKKIVCVMSGGNIDTPTLARVLTSNF